MPLSFATQPGPGYIATSTTSITIGTGLQTFTVQSGLAYQNGAFVSILSTGSGATEYGQVTSYSGTSLQLVVLTTSGSGSHSDWSINLASPPPVPGPWIAVTFTNSWANVTSYNASRYRLEADQTGPNNALITCIGSSGAITASTLTLNSGGVTSQVANTSVLGLGVAGFQVQNNTSNVFSALVPGLFFGLNSAQTIGASLGYNGTNGILTIDNGSLNITLTATGSSTTVVISNLPSSSPGAGTKQLWYDPSDSDRVKFAA